MKQAGKLPAVLLQRYLRGKAMDQEIQTKECSKCHKIKPFCEYSRNKHTKDGFKHYCKSCRKIEYIEYEKIKKMDNLQHITLPLEKSQQSLKTCQLCGRYFDNLLGLSLHLHRIHKISVKTHYNNFFKQPNEGLCKFCNNITNFESKYPLKYYDYCSTKCSMNSDIILNKIKNSWNKKSLLDISNINTKRSVTTFNNSGFKNSSQNPLIKEKKKLTNIKKYGVEYISQVPVFKEKKKQTLLRNYGVENPYQNKNILQKALKTSLSKKPYILPSGKIIHKQGYEPQFLDYVFKNNILKEDEIDYNPDGIKYMDKDYKSHYYFPDFYIPKWNLIIETKSDWTESLDKNVNLKETATKVNGFNYIRILNIKGKRILDFNNFIELLQSRF